MDSSPIFVLPGLDGTDRLLDRFVELAPCPGAVSVLALPDDPLDGYNSLANRFGELVKKCRSCHIIAESFSGPLGVLLAHRFPGIVDQLTLVATFVTAPTPAIARLLPWSMLFRIPMPNFVARRYFVGSEPSMVGKLKDAIRQTSRETLVKRMQCAMKVDVADELSQLRCHITYIRPEYDRLVTKRSLNRIIDANPNVVVREIDGPHLIMQTRPKQVWESICN